MLDDLPFGADRVLLDLWEVEVPRQEGQGPVVGVCKLDSVLEHPALDWCLRIGVKV